MCELVSNMMVDDLLDKQSKIDFTVLNRNIEGGGGVWHDSEISKLTINLNTEVYGRGDKKGYLILNGSFTKKQVLEAIGGGFTFTAEVITGLRNSKLPFKPW